MARLILCMNCIFMTTLFVCHDQFIKIQYNNCIKSASQSLIDVLGKNRYSLTLTICYGLGCSINEIDFPSNESGLEVHK